MRLTRVVVAGLATSVVMGGAAVRAGEGTHLSLAAALGTLAPMMQLRGNVDDAIRRAFQSALKREPTSSELRRYRALVEDNNWTERDILRDLQSRTDYQRYSTNRRGVRPEAIVRRAYQDILGRDPDQEGLRTYRSKIIDESWTEQDVREALRNSPEYSSNTGGPMRTSSADRIIRRAYQDILNREPDPSGLETYRRNIIERGWDEQDVRQALQRSAERRGGVTDARGVRGVSAVSDASANDIVRRAYNTVLGREPDANGMRDYTARVLRDHWTEQQVIDALRNSDEYRARRR